MAISTDENVSKKEQKCRLYHVYMQNLPWTACQSDIIKFFKDLNVAEGCVLIHGSEAFVAFPDIVSATKAMLRSGSFLHGIKIEMSLVEKKFIPKMVLRNVCRTLNFDDEAIEKRPRLFSSERKKKIRPTRINGIRPTNSCPFLTDEIDNTVSLCKKTERSLSCSSEAAKQSHNGLKKIHPTNVADVNNYRKFLAFDPDNLYGAPKGRLASATALDKQF